MSPNNIIPKDYQPILDAMETEKAIKLIKDFFQINLAEALNLRRVTAPLFVKAGTGININSAKDIFISLPGMSFS